MMESILALIDKRIAFAERMRKTRPHEQTQWTITQKQFEALREEVAQGLHEISLEDHATASKAA